MSLDLVVSCFRDGALHALPAAFWRAARHPPAGLVQALGEPLQVERAEEIQAWVELA